VNGERGTVMEESKLFAGCDDLVGRPLSASVRYRDGTNSTGADQ
jgi:hypothetical protein